MTFSPFGEICFRHMGQWKRTARELITVFIFSNLKQLIDNNLDAMSGERTTRVGYIINLIFCHYCVV